MWSRYGFVRECKVESNESAGLSELIAACRRRRWILAAVAAPLPLAAVLLALALPGNYKSTATFAIEESRLSGFQSSGQRDSYADQYVKDLEESVRRSDSLLRMLAPATDLPAEEAARDKLVRAADKRVDVRIVSRQVLDPQTGREKTIISSFSVTAGAPTATEAQRRAAWFAEEFVAADRRSRQQRAQSASAFLEAETERRRVTVGGKEKLLADFKQQNIGALPELNQLNLDFKNRAERDLQDSEVQVRTLVRERDFVQQQLQQTRNQSPSTERIQQLEEEYRRRLQIYDDSHPDMVAMRREIDELRSSGLQSGASISSQLAAEQAALVQARTRYSAEHPDIKRMEHRVAELQARIAAGETGSSVTVPMNPMQMQLTSQLNSLNSQIASMQTGIGGIRGRISSVQGQITATPQVERQYTILTQDVSAARQAYQEVLAKKIDSESASEAIASGSVDAFRLIKRPSVPKSTSKTGKILLLLGALVLGAAMGAGAMVLAEIRDSTVRSSRDVFRVLGVSPLGIIPVMANTAARHVKTHRRLRLAGMVGAVTLILTFAGYGLLGS
jgi:uncharacterized protein involved in exopolysaccharide biosynthesis